MRNRVASSLEEVPLTGEVLDQFGRSAQTSPETLIRRFNSELADIRKDLDARKNMTDEERMNAPSWGLGSLVNGLNGVFSGAPYYGNTLSQPWTIGLSNAYTPATLNRILLSYTYMSQGLFRTVVNQPVDDAFRLGFSIKSEELDSKDIQVLERAMKRNQTAAAMRRMAKTIGSWVNYNACVDLARSDVSAIKAALYWGRLYGGGGLIINTDQDFRKELSVDRITKDSPLVFIPADRWELVLSNINIFDYKNPIPYDYYGYPLHASRVLKFLWNEAPSYIRLRLQGWGMSEIEHCVRSLNAYLKFENIIFELLDEAKIDVWKMKNYNSLLLSAAGTDRVQQAIMLTNQIKNTNNAIIMDSQDDYEQKQLGSIFSGLADVWEQLRLNICSDLKFPRNKLFGESATGFGGGEDALENYNATVEAIQWTAKPMIIDVAGLRCQQLFDFIPEDLDVEFPSPRVLKQTDQEEVKTKKQERVIALYDRGLYDGKEASESLQKEGLLVVETGVLKGTRQPVSPEAEQMEFAAEAERRQGKKRILGGDGDKKKEKAAA